MDNIIEALQKNEKPFGLMPEAMQAKANEIGRDNFDCWCEDKWDDRLHGLFSGTNTYRLRTEPEAGVEKWPVFEHDLEKKLMFEKGNEVNYTLTYAPNFPDFIGYEYEDGEISSVPRMYAKDGVWKCSIPCVEGYEIVTPTAVLFRKQ